MARGFAGIDRRFIGRVRRVDQAGSVGVGRGGLRRVGGFCHLNGQLSESLVARFVADANDKVVSAATFGHRGNAENPGFGIDCKQIGVNAAGYFKESATAFSIDHLKIEQLFAATID
ncbi:hypothetical protein [Tropicimonas sp.]|uniref:hypothetical protein n=1 Tax=Tropicimonas sp. TaxID=2067044 RepID=UPI003A845867